VTRGKILVIRGGAIGDFILTLPVLAALRRQFPQARLELLGYSHIAQLALASGLADEIRSIEARPLASFFARGGNLDAALQEFFSSFAIIVSYLYDPDEIFQANVAHCSKAQFIAGPHRPDERAGLHATEFFLKPLERLAIFDADTVPRLSLNAEPATLNQLALHPGSGSERKNWPEAKWAALMRQLSRTTQRNFLLVGGEAEEDRLARLSASLPKSRFQRAENLPLAELAQRLAACSAFIGHDSGISHLAAAVGLPTLVLWGDTVEAVWRPQGERVQIVRGDASLEQLRVSEVVEQLANLLPGAASRC
jgi:ADP-heptose:LPS heptosyltransferase